MFVKSTKGGEEKEEEEKEEEKGEEEMGEKKSLGCIHLKDIYFFGLVNKNMDVDGSQDNEQQPSALDLIPQNPHLLRIHFFDIEVMARLWTPIRLAGLRHHQSLQSITLLFTIHVYDIYIIRKIFAHCPDTLQEFKITAFGGSILRSSAVEKEEEENEDEKVRMRRWRVLPQMRDLTIEMSLHPCEESILFPLLKSCPHLTRLRLNTVYDKLDALMDVLIQAPFRKTVVQLELPSLLPTTAYSVQFMSMFCGLTSLTMRITAGGVDVVTKMIESSGTTLEHIRLIEGPTRTHYAAGIDMILEKCPRLKTLRVDRLGNSSGMGVSISQLLETDPWACMETLEELAFTIDSPSSQDLDHWSAEYGVLLIVRLFERLKGLSRLRKVRLVWGGGMWGLWRTIPYEKGTRVLEASGRGMTMTDVEWMGLYLA
jgi:hypothetical protein